MELPLTKRLVEARGVQIWTDSFGDSDNPTIVLIMGAGASGVLWEPEFCRMLANRGRHVIRFDNRDTGKTTTSGITVTAYTVSDMAADVVSILNACEVKKAHIVGASMGGIIAQHVALEHPDRVLSITLIFSTPWVSEIVASITDEMFGSDLPNPSSSFIRYARDFADRGPVSRDQWNGERVEGFRHQAGSKYPFDDVHFRDLASLEYDHANDIEAIGNHGAACLNSGTDLRPRISKLDVPSLVIHGSDDPVLPYAHGQALAEAIPGAKLLTLEGLATSLAPKFIRSGPMRLSNTLGIDGVDVQVPALFLITIGLYLHALICCTLAMGIRLELKHVHA